MNSKVIICKKMQENEDFLKAIISVEDANTAKKVLSDYHIDLPLEAVESLFEDGKKEIERARIYNAELTEDELVSVAGGGVVRGLVRVGVSACAVYGYSLVVAACPPAIIAAPAIAAGLGLWSRAGVEKKGW